MKKIIACLCCVSMLLLVGFENQTKEKTEDPWQDTTAEKLDFEDFYLTSFDHTDQAYRYEKDQIVHAKIVDEHEEVTDEFAYHKESRTLIHTRTKKVDPTKVTNEIHLQLDEDMKIKRVDLVHTTIETDYAWSIEDDPVFGSFQRDGSELPSNTTSISITGVLKDKEEKNIDVNDGFTYVVEQK